MFADAGGGEVGVDVGLRCVVGGDDVVAPAFLVEAEERAGALGVVVGERSLADHAVGVGVGVVHVRVGRVIRPDRSDRMSCLSLGGMIGDED